MRSLFFILCIFLLSRTGFSQIQEENTNNELKQFKIEIQKLSDFEDDANKKDLVNSVEKYQHTTPAINEIYTKFQASIRQISDKIKTQEALYQKQSDEPNYPSISGYVESREKGFAIINMGNNRCALKSSLKLGAQYNGCIKPIDGTTDYVAPGNYQYRLGNYAPVKNNNREEKLNAIGTTIKNLGTQQVSLYGELITDIVASINTTISSNNNKIVETRYNQGSTDFTNSNFSSALINFTAVYELNNNYKDIKSRVIDARNNYDYTDGLKLEQNQAAVGAYSCFYNLAYPAPFKNAKEKFKQLFETYYLSQIQEAASAKNLEQYISVFDTLSKKYSDGYDNLYFKSLITSWKKPFEEFVKTNYSAKVSLDKFIVIPSGYYYTSYGDKVRIETFCVKAAPHNFDLMRSFEIVFESNVISDKENRHDIEMKNVPTGVQQKFAAWLGYSLLSVSEFEYLKCDGWRSLAENDKYTLGNASAYTNYGVTDELYFKIDMANLSEKELSFISDKASSNRSEVSNRVNIQKDYAIQQGAILAPHRLYITPTVGIGYESITWAPVNLVTAADIAQVNESVVPLEAGIFIGANLSSLFSEGSEDFGGIGVGVNYVQVLNSSLITSKNIIIESSKLNIKGLEIELRYQRKISVGIGMSFYKYDYTFNSQGIIGYQESNEKLQDFFIHFGWDWNYFSIYMKTHFSNFQNGIFAWDSKNLTGNVTLGMQLKLPIKLFRDEPLFY